jgi:SAM-dependent methyltransferase
MKVKDRDYLVESLNKLIREATRRVWPSKKMIAFYNAVGRIPLKIGTLLLVLTSIDAIKLVFLAGVLNRTDAALQVIYNYKFRPWRLVWAFGDWLWQGSCNCRSVRARGQFVQDAAQLLLSYVIGNNNNKILDKIVLVSLGSGSASKLLQGIVNNGFDISKLKVVLVDRDSRELRIGYKNACRLGLEKAVEFEEMVIARFLQRKCPLESVDFFEMVGMTDYFKDRQFSKYLERIYGRLKPGGLFLGSNISSKEESEYAHGAACWPEMHYRSKKSIIEELKKVGFKKIWIEEAGLYTVWVAQKS